MSEKQANVIIFIPKCIDILTFENGRLKKDTLKRLCFKNTTY